MLRGLINWLLKWSIDWLIIIFLLFSDGLLWRDRVLVKALYVTYQSGWPFRKWSFTVTWIYGCRSHTVVASNSVEIFLVRIECDLKGFISSSRGFNNQPFINYIPRIRWCCIDCSFIINAFTSIKRFRLEDDQTVLLHMIYRGF